MTENNQVQSDNVADEQSVQPTETPKEYTMEELKLRLKDVNAENKKFRLKVQEEKRQREESDRKYLEDSGKYKELSQKLTEELDHAKNTLQKTTSAFAIKTISDQVALVAKDLGCVDVEVVNSLIDMDKINVDDRLRADSVVLKSVVEDIRLKKPYLFQKSAPKISDVTPGGNKNVSAQKKLSELSSKEIEQMLITNYKK